ncbi:hypothetical protein AA101099_2638 [Neoasaia chiangmaiensis NBRC 101099]|uniref:Uncharacterized protein n=1 Tax=Neoasaia chiangmaiensis TaxID=320497 RepID=A0A1U9KPG1_9PROT|nr:hypothetical protein [Neoasaia chiangmaiensis]AQS87696.1 hypothetical protein A0U93_06860 [Neoasaia chiangmaiensis]GBR41826.1 hypothetical protein AA101099_2638 [Neoasaia chiangmaiensis NBRC 101099]GEN14285.1 hypothetical protein NCH01_07160 [Neoasaia chiangmaiensis]
MDLSTILAGIPARYELYAALLIIACKVVTIFVRPPDATSRYAPLFRIVSLLAMNIGWAANRLQVGQTGIMVPRVQSEQAKSAVANAGVPVLSKHKPG